MPTYVTLFNWTDQEISNVRKTIHRVERGVQLAEEKYGVRLREVYWTVGPYDIVAHWEASMNRALPPSCSNLAP